MDHQQDTVMGESGAATTIPIGGGPPQSRDLPQKLSASPPLGMNKVEAHYVPGPTVTGPGEAAHDFAPEQLTESLATLTAQGPLNDSSRSRSRSRSRSVSEVSGLDQDSLLNEASEWSSDEEILKTRKPPTSSLRTGVVYDIRMRYHCEVNPQTEVHPEDPRRIYVIYNMLRRAGLVEGSVKHPIVPPLQPIEIREATKDEICLVHSKAHFEFVESTQYMSDDELINLEKQRDSIYFNTLTFDSALLSTGGAIEACKAVVSREVKNAIAIIRPPGHHAEHQETMGFCLFNNVSVAAKVCQNDFGEKCRKILILDWDVHHGNGVQKAFYDDPNVLYISLHVYADGSFYPGSKNGNMDHCGEGAGLGKNINIPWPTQGMGDGDYMYAFNQVIMPIAFEFNPDLVIISAGFDAAAGDELGGCFVSPPCYAHMTHMLSTLADGKLAVCLEGGYNLNSISKSALAVTRTLMGETPDRMPPTVPSHAGAQVVRQVEQIQSRYWNCMFPKGPERGDRCSAFTSRVHDVIRQQQAKELYESYKLTSLYVYRDNISRSFENQVLATPNYDGTAPLLVIFHDPPGFMGIPDPMTNKIEAHNCWVADTLKGLIGSAVSRGYAVMDVNIPKVVTNGNTPGGYEHVDDNRTASTEELAAYLWQNYIEPYEHTEVFFIGIGDAFYGLANLLVRIENIYEHIESVVSFVAQNPVRAVASSNQPWLSKWYRDNSLVFVSNSHAVWEYAQSGKPITKRYGKLVRSDKTTLDDMVAAHHGEMFEWIDDRVERNDLRPLED